MTKVQVALFGGAPIILVSLGLFLMYLGNSLLGLAMMLSAPAVAVVCMVASRGRHSPRDLGRAARNGEVQRPCPKCGYKKSDRDAESCPKCGNKLKQISVQKA